MTIYCTGEYNELIGVYMDGKEVDKSNYTVTEGSTIVEFKADYLNTLSVGEHTITLRYTNSRSVDSKLTVDTNLNVDTDDTQDESNNDTDNIENEDSPATGDSSDNALWSVLLILTFVGLALGMMYRKKRLSF